MARSSGLLVDFRLPRLKSRDVATARTPSPVSRPTGASAVADVGAPGTFVWSYTRSSNSTRAFLNPVVLTFARLCATLSIFCCWALMPLAAVYSARIIYVLLEVGPAEAGHFGRQPQAGDVRPGTASLSNSLPP